MAKKDKAKVEQTNEMNHSNVNEMNHSKIDIVIQLLQDIKQLLEEKKIKEQNENRWRI